MEEIHRRERWSSRAAFILASIGASIGYGNVWRFPSLVYQYGGGAFFIPFLLALFIIGIPILILEISLGQAFQTGDMGAFGSMNRRLRGVGLSSVKNSYFIVCYYNALIAWTLNSFFNTFRDPTIWENDAVSHFLNNIIGMGSLTESGMATRLVPANVGYLALSWFIIFFCLVFGVKWEGRITYFTAGFPVIILFIFLGRGLSLPGSDIGVKAYVGSWDLSVLSEQPDCWSTACTQVFFSIGVTFGTFTAFGSHCDRNAPALTNAIIIALSDTLFAIVAGFAVFGTLGYVALTNGVMIDELDSSGMALLFGVFPEALSGLKGGIHWVRLLFFFLFLLGIDSAFALTQSPYVVLHDTRKFRPYSRWKLLLPVTMLGFLFGLMYVTDAGLFFLDVVDFYINFIMILVGFFECFAAGWMFDIDKQFQDMGKPMVLLYMFSTFASVIVASILWFLVDGINNMIVGFIALIVIWSLGMLGVLFFAKRIARESGATVKEVLYKLMFENIFELRDQLSDSVGRLPTIWCLLIKHVIPGLLLVLFINLAGAKTPSGLSLFGFYGDYATYPYQFLGILIVVLTLFILVLGFIFPDVLDIMADPEDTLKTINAAHNKANNGAVQTEAELS